MTTIRYYFNETRKQELDKMIADFSDEGCMFVEDIFTEFNACFRRGYDRSNCRLTVSFGDELGNDLTFILSREEIEYVTAGVTEKLDNLVCDSFAPYDGDDAEESTIKLTPVNTEKELDIWTTNRRSLPRMLWTIFLFFQTVKAQAGKLSSCKFPRHTPKSLDTQRFLGDVRSCKRAKAGRK